MTMNTKACRPVQAAGGFWLGLYIKLAKLQLIHLTL